ncbi:hypothetical protein ACFL0W_01515 [Nanoarchaeota archaeon]
MNWQGFLKNDCISGEAKFIKPWRGIRDMKFEGNLNLERLFEFIGFIIGSTLFFSIFYFVFSSFILSLKALTYPFFIGIVILIFLLIDFVIIFKKKRSSFIAIKNLTVIYKSFVFGFKKFSHNVIEVFNFILLLPVYILGVGPISIVAKILRKHFLKLKIDKDAKTYWDDVEEKDMDEELFYRQF